MSCIKTLLKPLTVVLTTHVFKFAHVLNLVQSRWRTKNTGEQLIKSHHALKRVDYQIKPAYEPVTTAWQNLNMHLN